jgi:RecB family endonuclease NucS
VPEQLPREHYLAAAARGRILAAEATTPRVKEYLQSRALECEQLADALGRGVNIPRHDDLDLLA